MINRRLLARLFNQRIRITGDDNPLVDKLYSGRYKWMKLDNLKVSPGVFRTILSHRKVIDGFNLRYDKRLAVIIPFRNRETHLSKLAPILKSHLNGEHIDHTIFVIEQSDNKLFNRAKLINAGVTIAGEDYDYYCFHDVDMLPEDCTYGYPSTPFRLFSTARGPQGIRTISNVFFSGIISVTKEDFFAANGFSNDFWHWGKEDDNFLIRLLLRGLNPVVDTRGTIFEFDDSTDRHNLTSGDTVTLSKKGTEKYIRRNRRIQNLVSRGIFDPFEGGIDTVDYELLCLSKDSLYVRAQVRL
jgi:hypothetical protein